MTFMQKACISAGALLAAAAIALSFSADAPVREALVKSQKAQKDWAKGPEAGFYRTVRKWGDWPWLMAGGAATLALCAALGNRKWGRVVAAAMIASTLAGVLANTSRLTTGRTRPRTSPEYPQGFYGPLHDGKLLVGNPKFNSFPSGHTATAFGFAGPIFFASPPAGVVALAGAALVAWASIALGAHHPSDVAVSTILSLVVSWFVWKFVRDKGDSIAGALAARARALWRKP